MFGTETAIGFLLSLVTFFRSEVGGRKTKEDLLEAIGRQDVIVSYLEWLRRRDQEALIREIEISKLDLLTEVSSLGKTLTLLSVDILQKAGDLEIRIHELNERVRPPVLSSISLPTRPRVNVAIKGRDEDMQWLSSCAGDALICGQPGSGKTALLQSFAADGAARFLITEDHEKAVAALITSPPQVVVVDDAGTKTNLLVRLRHLRAERNLNFRIFAIGWPFDKPALQQALQVNDSAMRELEGLPRKIIAEIIKDIAAVKGITVSDDFIRVVAKQARGMPGLASSLTMATLKETGEALVSGELLLKDLTPLLLEVAGPQMVLLLGAFACGGSKGLSIEAVARILGKEMTEVIVSAQRVALAGVLEQTGKATLRVQPEFLRSALIKETFFPVSGVGMSWEICEALIASGEDPSGGYRELVLARGRANAPISNHQLHEIALAVNNADFWESIACLDERNCAWVLENALNLSAGVKRAALQYIPRQIIPTMLELAAQDNRPLNSHPQADMRLLEEWAHSGWEDAFARREILFREALNWLKSGGKPATAFTAIRACLSLSYHNSDSDPADPRTMRFQRGVIPFSIAQKVFELWKVLIVELTNIETLPWGNVIPIVHKWRYSEAHSGAPLADDYKEFLISKAREMTCDLIPLVSDNQAVRRWIDLEMKSLGVASDSPLAAPDFMTLYPDDPLDGDWEAMRKEQVRRVEELASQWKQRPFADVVRDLAKWEQQTASLGHTWSEMTSAFASKFAEMRPLDSDELRLALASLPARTVGPFLENAVWGGRMLPAHFEQAIARSDLHASLISLTLSGKTPELYPRLQEYLPKWEPLVESLCLRGEVSEEMLRALLHHESAHLRREVAFSCRRSDTPIPPALWSIWQEAAIDALVGIAIQDDDPSHDLHEILDADPAIGPAVLERVLSSGRLFLSMRASTLLNSIIGPLSKDERRTLLQRCKHLVYSSLPEILVGRDNDLYREMLAIPELKSSFSKPLVGNPNDEDWAPRAKIALSAGFTHQDIAYAVNSSGYSWSGNVSTYYQQWVDRFILLRGNIDPDIQKIAEEGLKWSTSERDSHLKSEKREEIHGWD